MAGEWPERKLGDVITLKRGYDLASTARRPGTVPIISSGGISGFHDTVAAKGPGVVTGRYGTIGHVFYTSEDFWPLNTTLYVSDFKGSNPRFVSYCLKTLNFSAYSDKAAVPGINRNDLHEALVSWPDPREQFAIARVLASLDAKIDLNRQMAATLEEMARALFKNWFFHFAPVHAKAESRDTFLPADIAALFPESFDGEGLPEGWARVPFKAVLELTKGNSYKSSDLKPSDTALVTLKSFKRGGGYRRDGLKPFVGAYKSSQEVQPGDLILAVTDVTQAAEIVGQAAIVAPNPNFQHLIASLDVMIARPKYLEPWFWGHLLRAQQFTEMARNYTTGTTVLHLSSKIFDDFEFCVPENETLLPLLRDCVKPVVEKAQFLEQDCLVLEQLRDTLLPKLLAGEVRVSDAEAVIAAA